MHIMDYRIRKLYQTNLKYRIYMKENIHIVKVLFVIQCEVLGLPCVFFYIEFYLDGKNIFNVVFFFHKLQEVKKKNLKEQRHIASM